jgi:hypothetical protein
MRIYFGSITVKRLAVLITILLVVSLTFTNSFAAARDEQSDRPEKGQAAAKDGPTQTQKAISDANSPHDANAPAEPNAAEELPKELAEAMQHIDSEGRAETREWIRSETEDRTSLAKAVQEQVTTELNFLRQLAVEEGAVKTTNAIDLLLANRQKRFENILQRMEEEKTKDKEQGRTTRTRERTRDDDQRRLERERRLREREDRRTRDRQPARNPRTPD